MSKRIVYVYRDACPQLSAASAAYYSGRGEQ